MLEALNADRAAQGLRAMNPATIDWMTEYGPAEFGCARTIRDAGVLVPPPLVLVNTNDDSGHVGRIKEAFSELVDEVLAHEDRGLDWWTWPR